MQSRPPDLDDDHDGAVDLNESARLVLQELEAMPWKFFWEKVIFQTTEHPLAETRLQLYTLGAHHG